MRLRPGREERGEGESGYEEEDEDEAAAML